MTMSEIETELDDLFAQARQTRLPADLQARILADAQHVQSDQKPSPIPPVRRGVWAQLQSAIGGWPALGGLAVAGLVGVWIGAASPSFLPDPAALFQQSDVNVFDAYNMSALIEEGS